MKNVRLQKDFWLYEFFESATADAMGINNMTDDIEVLAKIFFVSQQLQEVRDYVSAKHGGDMPIVIGSGFRCWDLNREVGGSPRSRHMAGPAVDIECPKLSNKQLFDDIREAGKLGFVQFDLMLLENHVRGIPDSGWIHLESMIESNRQRVNAFYRSF